jgi:hypothetical protein
MKKSFTLSDIQKSLMSAITGSSSENLIHIVSEKPPISISKRIGIYQEAYEIRMLESLRDDFPRVEERVGVEEFKKLALLFIKKYPSVYANLAEVSQNFPKFVKEISDELYELASLEWIEILAESARRIDPAKKVTFQEIESGIFFKLAQNPTLFVFEGQEKVSIAYHNSADVLVKEMTPADFKILKLLKVPMTVDELSNYLEKIQVNFEEVQLLISSWIKNEIIFCERVNYA